MYSPYKVQVIHNTQCTMLTYTYKLRLCMDTRFFIIQFTDVTHIYYTIRHSTSEIRQRQAQAQAYVRSAAHSTRLKTTRHKRQKQIQMRNAPEVCFRTHTAPHASTCQTPDITPVGVSTPPRRMSTDG